MRLSFSLLAAALACTVRADVKFTSPAAGASIPASSFSIAWADSGIAPALSTFSTYQIFLMAGGNNPDDATNAITVSIVPQGTFAAGSTVTPVIPLGWGGITPNAYYLKIIAVSTSGGQVINYSSRFSLTGMTGTFTPQIAAAIAAVGGSTAGPPTVNQVANAGGAAAAGGAFAVPYSLQTGLTRYAPMQGVPPTKITGVKSPTPLFPTSAFTVATTNMPLPTILKTETASQTFLVSTSINTVAAASQPVREANGAQQRFLERWKD